MGTWTMGAVRDAGLTQRRPGETNLHSRARIAEGDTVEAGFQRGKSILTPKLVIDRSEFPNAADEYSPAQRRVIDAQLAESLEDFKKDRGFGPFNTAEEMITHMKAELKKPARPEKLRTRRQRLIICRALRSPADAPA